MSRYFASLSLFSFSMLGIVLSNNFIQIFIFWELVGLSSYLLIGFWYEKPEASTAGKKAFLTTRVGDVGMMVGILALFGFLSKQGLPTFNFALIRDNLDSVSIPEAWMFFICLGIFLGAVGKSAQVPLHVWLPDAMEGPTPVSALIHAATMVAAGIFLVVRVFFLFEASPAAMLAVAWTGGITSVIAATIALVQNDIKKVLAYSTLSQLGYMVMALGLGSPEAGMFHLTTHAFFKALLFLGAGSLIHSMHTQDIWEMGTMVRAEGGRFTLFKKMPVTAFTFLIGTLALMGIPPLSGFFSKEEILAAANHGPKVLFFIAMATVFLTAFYMGRVFTLVFLPQERAAGHGHGHDDDSHHGIHEGDWRITVPLIILAVLSVIGGYLPIKELLADGHGHHGAHHGFDALAVLSLVLYRRRTHGIQDSVPALRAPGAVLSRKYFFDDLYDALIKYVQEAIARVCDIFERYVVVEWTVNGLARSVRSWGHMARKLQTGVVQFYALFFTLGIALMIYYVIFSGKA
jgi:NADH-quinone oxidoreductase subunit L